MTKIRIAYKNYWRKGTILGQSSEHPQYPATDTQVDTLVQFWRTRHGTSSGNGLFVIAATNKYIDFDEGGAELTATLTPGNYNAQTLVTEIQTRMDAAARTYTVSYSETTAKFTIARGAGNFTLRWQSGTNTANTAGTTLGFNVAANDTGAATYTSDYRRIHYPNAYISCNLGAAYEINYMALLNHNFSASATISVIGASDSAFTTDISTTSVTYNASNIRKHLASSVTRQYWKIQVADPTNTNSYIQLATPILTKYWQPAINIKLGYSDGYDDISPIEMSDSLNEFGQEKPIYKDVEYPLIVSDSEKTTDVDSFLQWTGIVYGYDVCLDYDAPNTASYFLKNRELAKPTLNEAGYWDWLIRAKQVL